MLAIYAVYYFDVSGDDYMPDATHQIPRTVVVSFLECEKALAEVLRVVPWCDKHNSVWSPMLTTIIMEACTQLDSLWGYTAWLSEYVRDSKKRNQLTIIDYFSYFSNVSLTPLGKRWVVFWGGDPIRIQPFSSWDGVNQYVPIDWWQAYNSLKHDRLVNQEEATLRVAVNAVAGLYLAILLCDYCSFAIEAAGWLTARDHMEHNPKAALMEDSPSAKCGYVLAETTLFSYPVGWCNETENLKDWKGKCSFRFRHWFNEYVESRKRNGG